MLFRLRRSEDLLQCLRRRGERLVFLAQRNFTSWDWLTPLLPTRRRLMERLVEQFLKEVRQLIRSIFEWICLVLIGLFFSLAIPLLVILCAVDDSAITQMISAGFLMFWMLFLVVSREWIMSE